MRHIIKNQRGQGLIEYMILVAIIAVGAIVSVRVLGQSVKVKMSSVAKSLGATVEGGQISSAKINEAAWKKNDMRDFMSGSLNKSKNNNSSNETED